jgi:hypothetical protein
MPLYPYVRTSVVTDRYVVGSPRPDEEPPEVLVCGEGGEARVYLRGRYAGQLLGVEEKPRATGGLEFVLLLRTTGASLKTETETAVSA